MQSKKCSMNVLFRACVERNLVLFLSILFSLGSSVVLFAQDSTRLTQQSFHGVEVIAYGDITSNAVANAFIRSLYYNKYIDNEAKEEVIAKAKLFNRLGGVSKVGLTYLYQKEKNKPILSFSLFDRMNLNSKFSDDLFAVVFFGNKSYAGKTASVGPFNFNFLRYQQLSVGWKWDKDSTSHSYGFSISVLNGQKNLSIQSNKANLFTAEDGTYVDFDVSMQANNTDSLNKHFFANNGVGFSSDFFYKIPFKFFEKQSALFIEVEDLGFIRWNKKSVQLSSDSSYHYEGILVNDIFNLNNTSSSKNLYDVIDKHTNSIQKSYSTFLPGLIHLHTNYSWKSRIMVEKGISYRFNSTANLFLYAKIHFMLGKSKLTDIACNVGYGDYGNFRSGIDFKTGFIKHYVIQLSTQYIFSNLFLKAPAGMGIYLRLLRTF